MGKWRGMESITHTKLNNNVHMTGDKAELKTRQNLTSSECYLGLDAGLEVGANLAVDSLQVAATSGTGSATLNGLDGPVETTAGGAGVGAGGTTLPLDVVGVTAATAAQDVGASVTLSHGGCTLGHRW